MKILLEQIVKKQEGEYMHDVISGSHNCYKGKENGVGLKSDVRVGGYFISGGKESLSGSALNRSMQGLLQ